MPGSSGFSRGSASLPKRASGTSLTYREACVFLAVRNLGENAYSSAIHRHISTVGHLAYTVGSVHTILRRLEATDCLMSHTTAPESRRGGRSRIVYGPTVTGEAALKEYLADMDALRAGTEYERDAPRKARAYRSRKTGEAVSTAAEIPDRETILRALTWNAAWNLKETVTGPHERFPDLLNGGRRISTGLGKWTSLAAGGVESNLRKHGLVEPRWLPWNGPDRHQGWESLCLTPLGREIAAHVDAHWDTLTFRDGSRRV